VVSAEAQDYVLGYSQPSPFGFAQDRLCGTVSWQEQTDSVEILCYPKHDFRDSINAIVGFARRFRPRYAGANLGHPSCSIWFCYDTDSFGTRSEVVT
jgi:hypothetical protein